MDFFTTGIVQNSTNWNDGLHQFLQIKHQLKMTSESLTTNFLSNISYIKRYGKNIFGLSGTLGSQETQKILSNVYNLDILEIIPSNKKQNIRYPDIEVYGRITWIKEIVNSAITECNKSRGVLIICQTIEEANTISSALKTK